MHFCGLRSTQQYGEGDNQTSTGDQLDGSLRKVSSFNGPRKAFRLKIRQPIEVTDSHANAARQRQCLKNSMPERNKSQMLEQDNASVPTSPQSTLTKLLPILKANKKLPLLIPTKTAKVQCILDPSDNVFVADTISCFNFAIDVKMSPLCSLLVTDPGFDP